MHTSNSIMKPLKSLSVAISVLFAKSWDSLKTHNIVSKLQWTVEGRS